MPPEPPLSEDERLALLAATNPKLLLCGLRRVYPDPLADDLQAILRQPD